MSEAVKISDVSGDDVPAYGSMVGDEDETVDGALGLS